MPAFDKIIQGAAESLFGDERLRSNLTDQEAKLVLDWALARIKAQANAAKDETSARQVTQGELTRVRGVLNALNGAAKPGAPRLSDAVAAIEPLLQMGRPFTREEILRLVTALVGAVSQIRDRPGGGQT